MSDLFNTPAKVTPPPPEKEDAPITPAGLKNAPYSVKELSEKVQSLIKGEFGTVQVQGKISDLSKKNHYYLNLKDQADVMVRGQVKTKNFTLKAVIWESVVRKIITELGEEIENDVEVIASGELTTYYENRSEYQLIIKKIEKVKTLESQIEEWREILKKEGIFDIPKKTLPLYPTSLGIITSKEGAVIHDIEGSLKDRLALDIFLIDVNVQGVGAARQICDALSCFDNSSSPPDVIIIARGGGSAEDLIAFSDLELVRKVARSSIPIIAAIGHTKDKALINEVAAEEAITPTAAGNLIGRHKDEASKDVNRHFSVITDKVKNRLKNLNFEIKQYKLPPSDALLNGQRQALNNRSEALQNKIELLQERKRHNLEKISAQLRNPKSDLLARNQRNKETLKRHGDSLSKYMQDILARKGTHLQNTGQLLENSDYRKTMERGFAIIRSKQNGEWVVRASADSVSENDEVNIAFHDGDTDAIIKSKKI